MPRAPLWAPLTLSFVNSLGTGTITAGIFFFTEQALGYGRTQNFALGVASGLVYVASAFGIGPLIARARGRLTSRRVLTIALWGQGLACTLPLLALLITGSHQAVAWWALALLYGLFSGAMWPPIESYLAGGRKGPALARATGLFNILWASAMIVAYWAMAPLVEQSQQYAVLALGACQVASVLIVRTLPAQSAPPIDTTEPHPPRYDLLLAVFRILLPTSYLVAATIHPILPTTMNELSIAPAWRTPLASIWLISRLIGFIVFERWHGWRGGWALPIVGPAMLVGGFAAVVAAPATGANFAMPTLALGLCSFGLGAAAIYAAAIYYAMTVGHAGVGAGGTHEALIGVGMTAGPGAGLLVSGSIGTGFVAPRHFEPVLIATVVLTAALVAGIRLGMLWRHSRHASLHRRAANRSNGTGPPGATGGTGSE